MGPLDQISIRANIKVSSTETGHIFGTIVYENSSTAEKTYINLNNIHLDIMEVDKAPVKQGHLTWIPKCKCRRSSRSSLPARVLCRPGCRPPTRAKPRALCAKLDDEQYPGAAQRPGRAPHDKGGEHACHELGSEHLRIRSLLW